MASEFDYIPDWDDDRITHDVQQMFSRGMPAYKPSSEYVKRVQKKLETERTPHIVNKSVDLQRIANTRAEFVPATSDGIINALNKDTKEPETLLFWKGATFEATLNGDGYNQSQLLLMINVPTQEELNSRLPITLMAAPSGDTYIDLSDGVPTQEVLKAQN